MHLVGVNCFGTLWIAARSAPSERAAILRRKTLILAKHFSIGLKSGE